MSDSPTIAMDIATKPPRDVARTGVLCGASAHLLWGFLPLYLKLVIQVPPSQILAHRIVWSLLLVALVTIVRGGWEELGRVVRDRNALLMLCASTIFLSINWFVFIFAVNTGHTVQASMGYFINPLLSVLLGMIFLHERARTWQSVGLVLAAIGVVYLTWAHGSVPWIALALAGSFGLYALLRKTVRAGSMAGLTIETAMMFVPAMAGIVVYETRYPSYDRQTWMLLPLSGIVTAVPLLLFAAAARRLRLMTMGFLQYLTPTCHFLLAVFAFHEPLDPRDLVSFCFIWAALAIYSWDSYRGIAERMKAQG